MLKEMPPNTIFATGVSMDLPEQLFIANTGRELRWIAIRGGVDDWAIYTHFSDRDINWIKRFGDKVMSPEYIRMLVPCDNEAFKRYRY